MHLPLATAKASLAAEELLHSVLSKSFLHVNLLLVVPPTSSAKGEIKLAEVERETRYIHSHQEKGCQLCQATLSIDPTNSLSIFVFQ